MLYKPSCLFSEVFMKVFTPTWRWKSWLKPSTSWLRDTDARSWGLLLNLWDTIETYCVKLYRKIFPYIISSDPQKRTTTMINICCKWVCIFEHFRTDSHLDFNEETWCGKFQMTLTDNFGCQTNLRLRRIFYCAIGSTGLCSNPQDSASGVRIGINTHIRNSNTRDL